MNFKETLNEFYNAPTLINSLVRAQMLQNGLPPVPKNGKYAEDIHTSTPEVPTPIVAKTFNELMGIFGGFSILGGLVVMSYSSDEIKRRYRIKLIAMKAFMKS